MATRAMNKVIRQLGTAVLGEVGARPSRNPVRRTSVESPAERCEPEHLEKASVQGKYSILLKRIEVKADRDGHTDFHDYGSWSGTSYAGYDDLPLGYWVYVYPHWYIWGARDLKKASVGGKCSILLRKIEVEADREGYQDFHDYGEWTGTSYAGYDDLPAGYWVYVYPHWYIWGETTKDR